MRLTLVLALALAGCGSDADRVTDAEAAAEQNSMIGAPLPIEQPPGAAPAAPTTPDTREYKAIGTEPGWLLSVRPAGMTYEGDYGSTKISEPTPAGFRIAPGTYAGKRLSLTIAPGPCNDGMSDRVYRHTVELTADGTTVSGCGGGEVAAPASDGDRPVESNPTGG